MHALTWQRQFLRLQNLTEKWQTLCTSKPFFQKGCPIIGKISVLVKYKEFHRVLPLLVVKGAGPNLFGRGLSKLFQAKTCPTCFKDKVGKELDRLVAEGILSPVQFSKWAALIVPVVKHNGSIRICGDFKVTINQVSCLDSYPLPRIKELFAKLSGGKYFSKLDLSQAYLQLPLKESSKEFITINTYNRLPFRVVSAPAIFQRYMETLLQDYKGVTVYLEDILVTGSSVENHLENLKVVLSKLNKAGLHLNKDKCKFMRTKVKYLGHVIDREGLHPSAEKVGHTRSSQTKRCV